MSILRNLFAIIGLLVVLSLVAAGIKFTPMITQLTKFDSKALDTYAELITKLIETGNAAAATVWKTPVKDGLSVTDVEEAMKSVATEYNIKNVGELPLSKQISLMSDKKFRLLKIYMYCNPLTAAKMVDYNDAFSAYLPCRVSLVEDKKGKLWIYSLNMDMMIYGGTPLPPALKKEALRVKEIIQAIMNRGASGEF
ncbi:hypothetical protein MNBD_GAMMA22-434 [hydrothermal vent metagenome]|uniref:DUF302 domain-containing protein n=1 Tax=hydrothermal vent metagenome TaxID=652676 RepID=A0A3B1AEE0_9ZZZZ